jgi:ferrous iron transport protein B
LAGNPNTGKSTLFNAITGAHAHTGNRHGVTVGATSKRVKQGKEETIYTDLPGIYSLRGYSLEERTGIEYLESHKNALVVNVIDVRRLNGSIILTEELARRGEKCVVVLTMYKAFLRRGGRLDEKELSRRLGVPVFIVDAYDRRAVQSLKKKLSDDELFRVPRSGKPKISDIYFPAKREETWVEKLLFNRFLCLPIFFLLTAFIFFVTFGENMPGMILKNFTESGLRFLGGAVAERISSPVVRSLWVDGLVLPVSGVIAFLPQIAILYAFLQFLEESGYMSALAFSADGVFAKAGLNGRAVFCLLLGFGCSAQAILSTRGFEDEKMQRRTIYALSYISCSAKLPVYVTLLSSFFSDPFPAVLLLYALGVLTALGVFYFFSNGKEGDFILELPEIQLPNPFFFVKTLLFRLKQFIIKVATVVAVFTIAVWFFSSFSFRLEYVETERSMLAFFCKGLQYLLYPIGIKDWKMTFALFSGLIAKENVAGLLAVFYPSGLHISAYSAFSLAVFILYCSPCISAITAAARELGAKRAIGNAVLQTISALLIAYAMYYALHNILLFVVGAALSLLLLWMKRFCFEGIYRKARGFVKKIHR